MLTFVFSMVTPLSVRRDYIESIYKFIAINKMYCDDINIYGFGVIFNQAKTKFKAVKNRFKFITNYNN